MGATSLLNVDCLALSGLLLLSAAFAASSKKHRTLPLRASIATSLDRDFHLDVRPAAMIAKIPGELAGTVVDHGLEHVFAGVTETGVGGCLAVDDRRFPWIERHRTRASVLGPDDGHSDWFAADRKSTRLNSSHT